MLRFFSPNTCLPNVWHLRSTGSSRRLAEGSNFCRNRPWPEANIGITIHQRHPMAAHTFIPQRGKWGPALAPLQHGMLPALLSWCCCHPRLCPAPRSCICSRKWILNLPGLECLFFFKIIYSRRQMSFLFLGGVFGSSPVRCTSQSVLCAGDSVTLLHTQGGVAVACGKLE